MYLSKKLKILLIKGTISFPLYSFICIKFCLWQIFCNEHKRRDLWNPNYALSENPIFKSF